MIGRMRKNKRVARAACSAKQKLEITTDMCVQKLKAFLQAVQN